jgi:hypothetical protein
MVIFEHVYTDGLPGSESSTENKKNDTYRSVYEYKKNDKIFKIAILSNFILSRQMPGDIDIGLGSSFDCGCVLYIDEWCLCDIHTKEIEYIVDKCVKCKYICEATWNLCETHSKKLIDILIEYMNE